MRRELIRLRNRSEEWRNLASWHQHRTDGHDFEELARGAAARREDHMRLHGGQRLGDPIGLVELDRPSSPARMARSRGIACRFWTNACRFWTWEMKEINSIGRGLFQ